MSDGDGSTAHVSRHVRLPGANDVTVYGLLGALGDPIRLAIVEQLARHGEARPSAFVHLTSKQNLTHHLTVLRDAGVLGARYEGRNKMLWLRRDLMDEIAPGLLAGVLSAIAPRKPKLR